MMVQHEMKLDEALHLFAESREINWSYPTSMGRPVRWDAPDRWVQQITQKKQSFVQAARVLTGEGQGEKAVEMAANTWRLWVLSRDIINGRDFLVEVLDKGPQGDSSARALALYGDGLLAFRAGNLVDSKKRNEEALSIAVKIEDDQAGGFAHLGLSRVAFEEGNYEKARSHAVKARDLLSGLAPTFGQAPLFMHAESMRMLKEYEDASYLFEQSLDLNRRIGDKGMVFAELCNLGRVEIHRGNVDLAEQCFTEAEALARRTNPYDKASILLNQAAVALLKGNQASAESFLAQTKATVKESGIEFGPDDKFDLNWLTQKVEEASRR